MLDDRTRTRLRQERLMLEGYRSLACVTGTGPVSLAMKCRMEQAEDRLCSLLEQAFKEEMGNGSPANIGGDMCGRIHYDGDCDLLPGRTRRGTTG